MSRHATIETPVDHPETVARALRPDNTPQMRTRVADDAVVTDIDRDTTGGLRATADDYVVNLTVATRAVQLAKNHQTSNNE